MIPHSSKLVWNFQGRMNSVTVLTSQNLIVLSEVSSAEKHLRSCNGNIKWPHIKLAKLPKYALKYNFSPNSKKTRETVPNHPEWEKKTNQERWTHKCSHNKPEKE